METVSVETISETVNSSDCQNNPELSEKQKKKSGKKKKSRKQENELKSNDSHITSQNENADESFSAEEKKVGEVEKSTSEGKDQLSENCLSILPAESCQRDSVSCEEPGATLHHTDPIFSTREDSLPDANSNDSGKKRTKRKGKKKKESSSCEEKMLDDAEKTTYEDQVHPPNNPLSNGKIQEEGSCKHTQDSCEKSGAAQLCVDLNLSTPEDSQPNATNMTCSKKRKRKKEKDRNTLKESGVDIHSSNSEVAAEYNNISEAGGSNSMNIEEKTVDSVLINSCLKSKDDTVEQQEGTDIKVNETVAQTQSHKAKKRKKRKTKTMEVCDPLGNALATSTKTGPVECVENNDVNGGRELTSNLASQGGKSATGEENDFQNLEKTKVKETDENMDVKEDVVEVKCNTISEAQGSKSTSAEEKSVASVVISSSKNDTAEQQESTDVKLSETVAQTQTPKAKKKKKRKTKTMEVCDPLGNTLATSTKCEPVECVENNDMNVGRELMGRVAIQRENSATGEENGFQNREKNKENETDENTELKEDVIGVKCNTISEAEGSKSTSVVEKSVASVVINSSKNDTAEQQESTYVKLDETVAETQTPKAKKKKKRKTKTMEVCDPLGNTLATSTISEPVEYVENNDMNVGRELMSHLASQRENSATQEESGFQNLEKSKEKETNENNEVKEDILGAGVCEVRSKKGKAKKKKTSSEDHKTADMEVCGPSGSVEGLLDHSNQEDMKDCDGNARQEFGGEDMTSKIEKSATREKSVQKSGKRKEMTKDKNIESSQDALVEEGVSDVGCKRKKRKRNKNTNCESVATMDTESVQCLLYPSNGEVLRNCDGNADGEIASKEDLASSIEDSATKGKSVQDVENTKEMEKDNKGEVDQDALGAEDVSKVELKTKKSKKKKKSLDHKTDGMEKDDHKADSMEKDDYKADSMEKDDHKTDSMEKDDVSLPRCSCEGQRTRKLVVFDLNGILADIVQGHTGELVPDGKVSYRSVFRRPFVASFLSFCFERFDVAIWSSRRIGLDYMVNIIMRNYARNLLFCFDQSKCSATKFKTQENNNKPLFLKDLRRVWDRFGTCFSCGKRKYDETNTLLVDDSPDKALCNPPHTGIFPLPYQYTDRQDSALGPEGELRKYLERLADAKNIQKFVAENPFGQTAITETHESWEFYSKVVEAHK